MRQNRRFGISVLVHVEHSAVLLRHVHSSGLEHIFKKHNSVRIRCSFVKMGLCEAQQTHAQNINRHTPGQCKHTLAHTFKTELP